MVKKVGRKLYKMIEVIFEQEKNRTIATDNGIIIGECDFTIQGDAWNIIHTVVNSKYQGQGIARKLVESVIENARKEKVKVIADCSYAKKALDESKQ